MSDFTHDALQRLLAESAGAESRSGSIAGPRRGPPVSDSPGPRTSDRQCCGVAMQAGRQEHRCNICGRIKMMSDHSAESMRTDTKHKRTPTHNESQRHKLIDELTHKAAVWKGTKIDRQILVEVATLFAEEQRRDPHCVNRGALKDEIIASLLDAICRREDLVFKRPTIADFMQLKHGYARGDKFVQRQRIGGGFAGLNLGKAAAPEAVARSCAARFVARAADELGAIISDGDYRDIVDRAVSVVVHSEKLGMTMGSNMHSKVAGAVALVAKFEEQRGGAFRLSTEAIERATDGTKSGTFMTFVELVEKNIAQFPMLAQGKVAASR